MKYKSQISVWPVKLFLTDFINDWSREKPLDLYKYVPVTYEINIRCNKTEVFIPGKPFFIEFLFTSKINLFNVFKRSPTPNRRTILLLPKINRLYTRISTHLSRRSNFDHFCTILTRAFSADFSCDKFWQWCADWSSSFLCDFGVFDFVVHFRIFHKLLVFD